MHVSSIACISCFITHIQFQRGQRSHTYPASHGLKEWLLWPQSNKVFEVNLISYPLYLLYPCYMYPTFNKETLIEKVWSPLWNKSVKRPKTMNHRYAACFMSVFYGKHSERWLYYPDLSSLWRFGNIFGMDLYFFELFTFLSGLITTPHAHITYVYSFSYVFQFTWSYGQEKSLSYYDLFETSEYYYTDTSPPSFSSTSSTTPPPLYSPSMLINNGLICKSTPLGRDVWSRGRSCE